MSARCEGKAKNRVFAEREAEGFVADTRITEKRAKEEGTNVCVREREREEKRAHERTSRDIKCCPRRADVT